MSWTYVIIGILAVLGILFGILQLWFWTLERKEASESAKIVKELTAKNIPKLTKEEQFAFVDGKWDWTKIQRHLNTSEVPILALEYFIDVKPEEYLEHLRRSNPPSTWKEDTYGEVEIRGIENGYEIVWFDHGQAITTKQFADYDKLLRYLVYTRLKSIGYKYRSMLEKSYYA